MNRTSLVVAALILGLSSASAGTDIRTLANGCAICHGTDGKPPPDGLERLAGMKKKEFIDSMHELQKSQKEGRIMHPISRGYSDAEIKQMADYFANIH